MSQRELQRDITIRIDHYIKFTFFGLALRNLLVLENILFILFSICFLANFFLQLKEHEGTFPNIPRACGIRTLLLFSCVCLEISGLFLEALHAFTIIYIFFVFSSLALRCLFVFSLPLSFELGFLFIFVRCTFYLFLIAPFRSFYGSLHV